MNDDWQSFLSGQHAAFAADPARVQHYGDASGELSAAASTAVLCDLSHCGVLGFAGDDAQSFLQGQLTCDVREATRTASRPGALCTPKGRALATFRLWQDAQGYLLQLPADLLEPVRKRLSMYVLRAKVKVSDRSADSIRLGVAGPKAATGLIEALGLAAAGALPDAPGVLEHGRIQVLALDGGRFELVIPPDEARALWQTLAGRFTPAGAPAWQWSAIAAGEAMLGVPTQDQFVPQMLNLDLVGGIGFDKGCYTGQEIVARTQYLGKLKQRLFSAHLPRPAAASTTEALPRPGDLLFTADFDGQSTGMIVDAAPAPGGGFDLLAVLRTDSAARHPVHWQHAEGALLERLRLPDAARIAPVRA